MTRSDRVRLATGTVMREEPFGALVYSHDQRRLLFVEPPLDAFLRSDGGRELGDIADSLVAGGALTAEAVPRMLTLLEGLRRRGVVDAL